MHNWNFTRAEAQALVGRRFETLVEWDRVTRGTVGSVTWSSGVEVWSRQGPYEDYQVMIAWDPPRGYTKVGEPPLRGRFSKFQIQKYMREQKP